MCEIRAYLLERAAAMLEGETVHWTREHLMQIVDRGAETAPGAGKIIGVGGASEPLLYSPAALAVRFDTSPRTITRWCQEGKFGPPEELRCESGRWRIPAANVGQFLKNPGRAGSGTEVPDSPRHSPPIAPLVPPGPPTAPRPRKKMSGPNRPQGKRIDLSGTWQLPGT